jgi:hypothetical protein
MKLVFSKWFRGYPWGPEALRLYARLLLGLLCGAVLLAGDDGDGNDSSDPKDTSASVAAEDPQTTMFPHGEWSHF